MLAIHDVCVGLTDLMQRIKFYFICLLYCSFTVSATKPFFFACIALIILAYGKYSHIHPESPTPFCVYGIRGHAALWPCFSGRIPI